MPEDPVAVNVVFFATVCALLPVFALALYGHGVLRRLSDRMDRLETRQRADRLERAALAERVSDEGAERER